MRLFAGTSGFSYSEWRGRFYPESLTESDMLGFYSARLPSVEINSTFYRMPTPEVLASWHDQVPGDFRFALKASRRITHQQKLANAVDSASYLFRVAAILKEKLGPILFQLPPFLRRDVVLLKEFLAALPEGCLAAFEFRHSSWFTDEVYTVLGERGAALCGGDLEQEDRSPPLVATTHWGYVRLRRSDYDEALLQRWVERLRNQPWEMAYAFFKHEELGPAFAQVLNGLFQGTDALPGLAKARASRPPPKSVPLPGIKSTRPKSPRSVAKKQLG